MTTIHILSFAGADPNTQAVLWPIGSGSSGNFGGRNEVHISNADEREGNGGLIWTGHVTWPQDPTISGKLFIRVTFSKEISRLEDEYENYQRLQKLQGKTIPLCYGLYKGTLSTTEDEFFALVLQHGGKRFKDHATVGPYGT